MNNSPAALPRRPKLLLYFHTLRYLRPFQLFRKPLSTIKRRLYQFCPGLWAWRYRCLETPLLTEDVIFLRGNCHHGLLSSFQDTAAILQRADRLLHGEFAFLHHTEHFATGADWCCQSASHLWRYQLHYFNWAWDLGCAYRLSSDRRYWAKFRELVDSWIESNPFGQLDGWHPYTISLRAVNWIWALELFKAELESDRGFLSHLLRSLFGQCLFLARHLETEAGGNHLLANYKALTFAGFFFVGRIPARWRQVGCKGLQEQLAEQILEDGGHFERSPMYHLLVMKDLVECALVLEHNASSSGLLPELKKKLGAMRIFAAHILSPEGRIPLLNDAAFDLTPDPGEIIALADWIANDGKAPLPRVSSYLLTGITCTPGSTAEAPDRSYSTALPVSGYFVMRDLENSCMVLDCGPVCPDYLPPHAHADTLGYELWVKGQKMITDSGTCEYTAGPWRDFFRSTRAHNTVVIDNCDQSEMWGSFRVARRAYPGEAIWISTPEADFFRGTHDGYLRLAYPVLHRRRILFLKGEWWLVLDEFSGKGHHQAESWIHLHPEAQADIVDESGCLEVTRHDQTITIWPLGGAEIRSASGRTVPIQGWYSEEFGCKLPRQSLCLTQTGTVPFLIGYLLVPRRAKTAAVRYELGLTETFTVCVGGEPRSVLVQPAERALVCVPEGSDTPSITP